MRVRTEPNSVFYVVKIMFLWVNAHPNSFFGRACQYQFNSIAGRYLSLIKLLLLQNNCHPNSLVAAGQYHPILSFVMDQCPSRFICMAVTLMPLPVQTRPNAS